MVKAMGLGLVTTYSDGSIYLSMFLLKITSYGQKKGHCGSVACPLFWVGVLVSDQWAVFLMSWSLNICSTILTGLRQMFICKVNSVYYFWYTFGFELTEQVLTIDAKRSDLLYLPASLESTVILCFVQYFLCVSNHVSTFDQACVCSAPPQYSVCVGQCVLL